jgi:uncharacterized membrane protein
MISEFGGQLSKRCAQNPNQEAHSPPRLSHVCDVVVVAAIVVVVVSVVVVGTIVIGVVVSAVLVVTALFALNSSSTFCTITCTSSN